MKAAIITIYDFNPNYGNRLQNYAVYQVLSRLNLEVTTLYVEKNKGYIYNHIKYWIHKSTNFYFCKNKGYWKCHHLKKMKFLKFNRTYISHQRIGNLSKLASKYDYFIVGSDQVWNPTWYDQCLMKKEVYLLNFAKSHQKICFSPSFGVGELPEKWKAHFQKSLQTFNNISVREDAGAEIVKQLTGKKAEVLIDPTLMLSKDEWRNIEVKPKNINLDKEYILTYFLGEETEATPKYIKKIAKDYNLSICNLLDMEQPELYIASPNEFIYLINHAKLVLTDSFHACVFSFIFGKPFQVFPRNGSENNMMSRIETLLDKFDLKRKLYNGNIKNDIFECNYSEGYIRLRKEQDKVNEFLGKSLKINN